MKQYFLADYRRAMTCRPHLVEIVLMAVAVILMAVWGRFTVDGNWNAVSYLSAISFPLSFMAMFLGLFDILAVFSEDFKAKTMQVAIGRGVSRTQVVLTKLLDVAMVLLTDLVLFFVLTVGLSWGLGAPLTGSRLTQHVIDFLVQWLDGIGYTAVVLSLLFHLQSMLMPILLYLILSGRAVYAILRLFTFWGPEWLQKLHLDNYTLDAFLDTLRTHLVLGQLNPGALVGIAVYLVLGTVAAVLVFRKQELEF